jgi:hypothetical protein
VGAAVGVEVASAIVAVGVGVGSSDRAGTPTTAANTAAAAKDVARIRRVTGEEVAGGGEVRLPPGVGICESPLELWA